MNLSISVVIPIYNGEKFLREAVDSVLCQTKSVQEIVLIDDGSKDGSFEIMQSIAESSPVPVVLRQQENCGVSVARNNGLASASCKLIAFLDVDDLWSPTKIEKQLAIYEKYKSESIYSFTDFFVNTKEKTKLQSAKYYNVCLEGNYTTEKFQKAFVSENFIGTASTSIFNREIALKIGGFNSRLNHSEDFDFVLRYSQLAEVRLVNEPLLIKRAHGANLTGNKKLHYWSHITSLKLNIELNSVYSRFNYSEKTIKQMRYYHDMYLIRLCNEVYEESWKEGFVALFKATLKVKSVNGFKQLFSAILRKSIRTLSFGIIHRKGN